MNGQATKRVAAKDTNSPSNGYGGSVARTTVVFPAALNANWEAYALKTGMAKNEVLIEALSRYLEKAGLQPDKHPTVKVSYGP